MENGSAARISKRNLIISIILVASMAALIVVLICDLLPLLREVAAHADDESTMVASIRSYGSRGVVVLGALHTLQVVTAVFPAQPIQMLAGLCYGIWYGLLICLGGIILGNVAAFTLSRQLGVTLAPVIRKYKLRRQEKRGDDSQTVMNASYIDRLKHPEVLAFILYFIPGLPNGFLPYIFAQTRISFPRYLLSIVAASIPSVLFCTVVGEKFAKGDSTTAWVLIGVLVLILVFAAIFSKKITALIKKKSRVKNADDAGTDTVTDTDTDLDANADSGNDTKAK